MRRVSARETLSRVIRERLRVRDLTGSFFSCILKKKRHPLKASIIDITAIFIERDEPSPGRKIDKTSNI